MNRKKMPQRGLLLVLLASAPGCRQPQNEFIPPPPPEVTVQPPEIRDVTVYRAFPGRVAAVDTVEIRARVRGYLTSADFNEGRRVQKNTPLFTIERLPYEIALQSAEAAEAQARAALLLADSAFQKKQQAFQTNAISEIDMLTAEAEKKQAEGALLAAQAQVEQAKLDLSYTEIAAPVSGIIGRREVSVGNLVGAGESTLLATVIVEDPIYVYFYPDERSILPYATQGSRSAIDQPAMPPVLLELADGSRYPTEGIVDFADNRLDPETGTLMVRARFENKEAALLPGMIGKILMPSEHPQAMLVPDQAIQADMSGSFVLIVDGNNVVQPRYLKLGPLVGSDRIVEEGLAPQDRVIVLGIQRARPGMAVNPVSPGQPVTPADSSDEN